MNEKAYGVVNGEAYARGKWKGIAGAVVNGQTLEAAIETAKKVKGAIVVELRGKGMGQLTQAEMCKICSIVWKPEQQ